MDKDLVINIKTETEEMKAKLLIAAINMLAMAAFSQTNNNDGPKFIKGGMTIQYNSKTQNGAKDVYQMDVNVCNSARFHGTITDKPQVLGGLITTKVVSPRLVEYNLDLDVLNPHNTAQSRNVGRMFGTVPINSGGVYLMDNGTLVTTILPIGNAGNISYKFTGSIAGKPMNRPPNYWDTFTGSAVSIYRTMGGNTTKIVLKKYDKMVYNNSVLGGGPVGRYQPVTVSGDMLYDYDQNCWFLNNMTCQSGGHFDRITGTIRWVESPDRKNNGEGQYEFDVRVNEPPPNEAAAFNSANTDESAFFTTDTTIPSLTGTMKYKDQLRGDTTLASAIAIDLTGNNLTREQTMELFKVILLSAVVPMNSD